MNAPPSIDAAHRPKLRDCLSAEEDGNRLVLVDQRRVGAPLTLNHFALQIAAHHFNGTKSLAEIHAELAASGDDGPTLADLVGLAQALDDALLLDGPQLRALLARPVREPTCIGCYEADPTALRAQLDRLFADEGGPGLPTAAAPSPDGRLRAVLVPHMDYARGNVTYGWGFKDLAEQTDATVFVIVATSHYSPHRFTLTRQHFRTPLGVAETDGAYVDRLAAAYGDGPFDDALAHAPEHSIELEVVLLQHLFAGKRPIRIVPLLVGSFDDCVRARTAPNRSDDIARMIEALRAAEAACSEEVCYVISGDLAHVGPKFGDEKPVGARFLAGGRKKDAALLERAAAADARGYFDAIAAEGNGRRICGLPPTYLTLEAIRPRLGRVRHYQQFVHPKGYESVSFASVSFYD